MRKRNHIIPLHLNKKELAHLETQVKQSGLPREEFLRTLIMGAELRAKPCNHHADLLHKVAGLCNNANQLAKVANTYVHATAAGLRMKDYVMETVTTVQENASDILASAKDLNEERAAKEAEEAAAAQLETSEEE